MPGFRNPVYSAIDSCLDFVGWFFRFTWANSLVMVVSFCDPMECCRPRVIYAAKVTI